MALINLISIKSHKLLSFRPLIKHSANYHLRLRNRMMDENHSTKYRVRKKHISGGIEGKKERGCSRWMLKKLIQLCSRDFSQQVCAMHWWSAFKWSPTSVSQRNRHMFIITLERNNRSEKWDKNLPFWRPVMQISVWQRPNKKKNKPWSQLWHTDKEFKLL